MGMGGIAKSSLQHTAGILESYTVTHTLSQVSQYNSQNQKLPCAASPPLSTNASATELPIVYTLGPWRTWT